MLNAEHGNQQEHSPSEQGYQLDSTTQEVVESKKSSGSRLSTKIGVGVLALTGLLGLSGEAQADEVIDLHNPNTITENNETRTAALVAHAQKTWEDLQPAVNGEELSVEQQRQMEVRWNELMTTLIVSDETAIAGIESIRNEIINEGATNANIPANVVETALYSGGILAGELNRRSDILDSRIDRREDAIQQLEDILDRSDQFDDAFLQSVRDGITRLEGEITSLETSIESLQNRIDAIPDSAMRYFGKNIVDIRDSHGNLERTLVASSDLENFEGRTGVTVYKGRNFENLAAFVVARSQDTEILQQALTQLQNETDPARRDRLLQIFETVPSSDIPSGMLEQSSRWVFNGAPGATASNGSSTSSSSSMSAGHREAIGRLRALEGRLVSPALPSIAELDQSQRDFIARNILILARTNQSEALCAAAQWFAQMDPDEVLTQRPTDADYMVLEALSIAAERSEVGFDVLEHVVASNPQLTLNQAMVGGIQQSDNTPRTRAAHALSRAFNAHQEESRELLRNIADGKSELLWESLDAEQVRAIRTAGRDAAIVNMIMHGSEQEFNDYYKSMLNNRFASDRELQLAISGLALSRDDSALNDILDIAIDQTRSSAIRGLAFEAALFIDTTDPVPASAREMAQAKLPYSIDGLGRYLPQYNADGTRMTSDQVVEAVNDVDQFNPFHHRMMDIYQEAIAHQKRFSGETPSLTREQQYELIQRARSLTLAGSRGVFTRAAAQDAEFTERYIEPMIEYFEKHSVRSRPIDTNMAINMLQVIRKVDASFAQERILDVYRNTSNYTHNETVIQQGGWAAQQVAQNEAMLKTAALQTLGSSVDLLNVNDESARILHIAAERESYPGYRAAARTGLLDLASRYEDAIAAETDEAELTRLRAAQRHHGEKVVQAMMHQNKGMDSETQVRLSNHRITHAYAGIAVEFGATQALMQEVDRLYLNNPNMLQPNGTEGTRPEIVRSIVNAMLQKGIDAEEIRGLSTDATVQRRYEDVFNFVAEQRFWSNQETSLENDGAGINLWVNDVGSVYGDVLNKDNVQFFSRAFDANRYIRASDSHPTGVAGTTLDHTPNVDNIYSIDVAATINIDNYRPEVYNDPLVLGREIMLEMMIMDQLDDVVSNQSIGYRNGAMVYQSVRDVLNQFAAFQMTADALAKADQTVRSVVVTAAGNSGGGSPYSERFGALGEVNVMGHFILEDGTIVAVPNSFTASALDSWSKRGPGAFSSRFPVTNEDTPFTLTGTPGASVPFYWQENGEWTLIQGNGTSFASPNLTAKIIEVLEELEENNVNATSEELSRLILGSTRVLPNHNAHEGGLELIDSELWQNVQRFIAEKQNNE